MLQQLWQKIASESLLLLYSTHMHQQTKFNSVSIFHILHANILGCMVVSNLAYTRQLTPYGNIGLRILSECPHKFLDGSLKSLPLWAGIADRPGWHNWGKVKPLRSCLLSRSYWVALLSFAQGHRGQRFHHSRLPSLLTRVWIPLGCVFSD